MGGEKLRRIREGPHQEETQVKHLFSDWQSVSSQVKSADHIFLLTNFDGTLTPIVSRPDLVSLDDEMKEILSSIPKKSRITFGVISGRPLKELEDLVGIKGIVYSGNHGFEVKCPKRKGYVHPEAQEAKPLIKKIARTLDERLSGIKGVKIEDKGLSLSLHYRMVDEKLVPKVKKIFNEETSPLVQRSRIKVTSGKKVLEARPPLEWDKGKAIAYIMKNAYPSKVSAGKKILAFYIGDDRTDEDGFLAMKEKGISIFVGKKKGSSAKYFLKDVGQVKEFLRKVDSI